MAGKENLGETTGRYIRNGGLIAAGIGIIEAIAGLELPILPAPGKLALSGLIFAAGGEGLRRISKPKQG